MKDCLAGRVKHGTRPGPPPYLTENELALFLVKFSQIGYGKTKREIISIVQRTLRKNAAQSPRSLQWRGLERHLRLSLRSSDPLLRVRANAFTEENMTAYFYIGYNINNMGEGGMPLDHK